MANDETDPVTWFKRLLNPNVQIVADSHITWDYDHPVRRSSVTMVQINERGPNTVLHRMYYDHLDDPSVDYQPLEGGPTDDG